MNDEIDVNVIIKSLAAKLSDAQINAAVLEAQLDKAKAALDVANQQIAELQSKLAAQPTDANLADAAV